MKKEPDILSLEEWKKFWEPWELEDPESDEIDNTFECPSCDGTGKITFDHSFKDENGRYEYTEYDVECSYCEGSGLIEVDCDRVTEYQLNQMYIEQVKKDKEKYKQYYDMIHKGK